MTPNYQRLYSPIESRILASPISVFWLTLLAKLLMKRFITLISKQYIQQGMVEGSASKPALRQDTGYMVEKTYYDIAQYLGAFGAYLMPQ